MDLDYVTKLSFSYFFDELVFMKQETEKRHWKKSFTYVDAYLFKLLYNNFFQKENLLIFSMPKSMAFDTKNKVVRS